jgi:hypothetical protein
MIAYSTTVVPFVLHFLCIISPSTRVCEVQTYSYGLQYQAEENKGALQWLVSLPGRLIRIAGCPPAGRRPEPQRYLYVQLAAALRPDAKEVTCSNPITRCCRSNMNTKGSCELDSGSLGRYREHPCTATDVPSNFVRVGCTFHACLRSSPW